MPHVDELFGVTTVAAVGLFAAIALQPVIDGAPGSAGTPANAPVAVVAPQPAAAPIVRLPSVEVVARRSVELARIEQQEKLARQCLAKDAARRKA